MRSYSQFFQRENITEMEVLYIKTLLFCRKNVWSSSQFFQQENVTEMDFESTAIPKESLMSDFIKLLML